MSKQVSPTLIGGFVIGAVLLLALGFAVFGGAELLTRKAYFTTYFEGSVQGLRVGSNVIFRGVRVGSVNNIELLTEVETLEPLVRVTMQLDPESVKTLRGNEVIEGSLQSVIGTERLLDAGLSAQLTSESLITGQLAIDLDFRPQRELTLRGADSKYPEIPGIQSNIQQLLEQFPQVLAKIQDNVDLEQLARDVQGIAKGVNELANSPDLRESFKGLNALVNGDDTQQLAVSVQGTLKDLRAAAASANKAFRTMERDTGDLTAALEPTAERLNAALLKAEQTLESADKLLKGDSDQSHQLESTLRELEASAKAARSLFDYLERHPESLLRGKPN